MPRDDQEKREFTPEQHDRILKMLEAHERAAGFWLVLGILVKWIGAALAALVAFKVLFLDSLKGLVR